jgi:hypothetical protein
MGGLDRDDVLMSISCFWGHAGKCVCRKHMFSGVGVIGQKLIIKSFKEKFFELATFL